MKSQAEEMFYLASIIISILMIASFLIYQSTTKGKEVQKASEERIITEALSNVMFSIFNSKLPVAEKYYFQLAIDGALEKKYEDVYYGEEIKAINITQTLETLLEKNFKGKWRIEIITPEKTQVYGNLKKENVAYTYENLVAVPDERVGKIVVSIGR
jgi:hypothetical protein